MLLPHSVRKPVLQPLNLRNAKIVLDIILVIRQVKLEIMRIIRHELHHLSLKPSGGLAHCRSLGKPPPVSLL
jgi:hypothetical protein